MKNNKNKILVASMCGLIAGSIGTSLVGNFQTINKANTQVSSSGSGSSSSGSSSSNNSNGSGNSSTSSSGESYGGKGNRGKGGKGGHHQGQASLDTTESVDVASGSYTDGTYEGTADGFSNNLKVQVSISGGKITDVQVVSHNETPGFYESAFEKVPQEIIEKQSTNVDTASGATYSSVGIINAVNNALSSAQA